MLSSPAKYGILPEMIPDKDLSPAETVRDTIRNVDGTIQFRVRSGKGAKPAKIPAGQFSEVVSLLRSTLPLVTEAASSLSPSDEEEAYEEEAYEECDDE